jgi:hypothetical protein
VITVKDIPPAPIYEPCLEGNFWVEHTEWQILRALWVGRTMWKESQKKKTQGKMRDYWGNKPDGASGLRLQQLGALAESVGAQGMGIYWPGHINNFKDPDLPHNIEVRLIGCEHYGLRVRESDDPDRRILGVVIPKGKEDGPYRIPGWIRAGDAMLHEEWSMNPWEGREMIAVPQNELGKPAELKRIIIQEMLEELDGHSTP